MSDPRPLPYVDQNGYLQFPIDTDPDILVADQLDFIAAKLPGFTPREGHLEVITLASYAAMCAETARVAAQVPLGIFQRFGQIVGIAPQNGNPATVATTWTLIDTKGYTIPAGTVVAFSTTGDQLVLFTVLNAVTVPVGSMTTAAGGVLLQASVVAASANGLTGTMKLIDPLAFVTTIITTAPSSGGVDAETDLAYLNRLSFQLQLLTPRPILPADFGRISSQTVGVARGLGIDGLNPSRSVTDGVTTSASPTVTSATAAFTTADVGRGITGAGIPAATFVGAINSATSIGLSSSATTNTPVNATATATGVTLTLARTTGQLRTVAVAAVDIAGAALTSTLKASLLANLTALRELNFVVNVIDPTYTLVAVTYTAVAAPGISVLPVKTAVDAALTAYLSPGSWAGGSSVPPLWRSGVNTVRYLDIANVIRSTPGVAYITTLSIGVQGSALGTTDVTLTGDGPLPQPGTINSNVITG
jgi:hypothetical protein